MYLPWTNSAKETNVWKVWKMSPHWRSIKSIFPSPPLSRFSETHQRHSNTPRCKKERELITKCQHFLKPNKNQGRLAKTSQDMRAPLPQLKKVLWIHCAPAIPPNQSFSTFPGSLACCLSSDPHSDSGLKLPDRTISVHAYLLKCARTHTHTHS